MEFKKYTIRLEDKIWIAPEPITKERIIHSYPSGWLRDFERGEAVYKHSERGDVAGRSGGGGGFVGLFLCTDKELKQMKGDHAELYDKTFELRLTEALHYKNNT